MSTRERLTPGLIRVCLLAAAAALVGAAGSQAQMTVQHDVHHDVSPAVRDLPSVSPGAARKHEEAEPVFPLPLPRGLKPAEEPDPVLQKATRAFAPSGQALALGRVFEGIGQGVYGFNVRVDPPDTNGAAGLTQYVQWVNHSFAVFDKATGALLKAPVDATSLWMNFPGLCATMGRGDGIVNYDRLADRWVISQLAFGLDNRGQKIPPFFECIAVSTTPDATGTFHRFSFEFDNLPDYPKIAVWPDAYYATFNTFDLNNIDPLRGGNVCAFDRNAMLQGLDAARICFQQPPEITGLLPSDFDGWVPPPGGSPNYILAFGTNPLQLFKFHVDFNTPANSTFSAATHIPVAPFTPLCGNARSCVPQKNVVDVLASLGDRLMYRLAYRNFGTHESLVTNHSVAVGTGGGIRWYEIQDPGGTPRVAEQSTFAPDGNFRWMGSIATDQAGDIALGYSVSGNNMFPGIAITGRTPADAPNTLEAETTVVNGGGSQTDDRWGDYSAMQIDPVDDCTFWYTNEYQRATNDHSWNTRIASFRFPNCQPKATLTVQLTLVPADDPGRFDLQIDGVTKAAAAGDRGSTGPVTVIAGNHTVAAMASAGTVARNYLTSIGGDCRANGAVSLAPRDNKICVITKRPGRRASMTASRTTKPASRIRASLRLRLPSCAGRRTRPADKNAGQDANHGGAQRALGNWLLHSTSENFAVPVAASVVILAGSEGATRQQGFSAACRSLTARDCGMMAWQPRAGPFALGAHAE
jgi:hypothetical protein